MYASDTLKTQASRRTLPLLPEIEEALKIKKAQIEENKKLYGKCYNQKYLDYVCVNDMGDLILPDFVTHHFSKVLKKNNLRHIRFHDLRHSCASLLVANKVPMKNVQEWLGHANFSTTADVYSHLDFSSKLESAQVISNMITNSPQNEEKNEISDEEYQEFLEWKKRKKLQSDSEM